MSLPGDGEVKCGRCTRPLNRTDRNCYACGCTNLIPVSAEMVALRTREEAPPRQEDPGPFGFSGYASNEVKCEHGILTRCFECGKFKCPTVGRCVECFRKVTRNTGYTFPCPKA